MIELKIEWWEVPCTAEPCVGCGEMILGKQYRLFTVIGNKATPLGQAACASCYMEIEKGKDSE